MRKTTQRLALGLVAAALSAPAAAYAEREDLHFDAFVVMCDADKDGMVSKSEIVKQVEKMFDKHDTTRRGMLDRLQLESFLRELMKSGA